MTFNIEHNQRLLLIRIKSLPALICYLEHVPCHYLSHTFLLQMLDFFLNINCFTTYMLLSFKCLVSRLYVIISMTFENEVSLDTGK